MKENNENQKQWMSADGNVLPTSKLQEISKNWDAQTWEQYLSEVVDVSTNERLLRPSKFDILCENQTESIFGEALDAHPLENLIRDKIKRLTPKQKKIINLYFYEGLSLRDISEKLNKDYSTVHESFSSALIKLRKSLKDPIKKPIVRGKNRFSESRGPFLDDQLSEVYWSEVNGIKF